MQQVYHKRVKINKSEKAHSIDINYYNCIDMLHIYLHKCLVMLQF